MVQVCALVLQRNALFEQIFVDVDDAAAGEDLVELVALQLVIASTAAHHHGLDVQIVERGRHTVEEHTVVRDHLLGLVELARAALGIAAAQVAGRQHGLHACVPEHGLRGQTDLAEQTLRAAAWEVEHRFGVRLGGLRVTDDGHVILVFNIQQGTCRLIGQATRQLLVDEVNHLLLDGSRTHRSGRMRGLLLGHGTQYIGGQTLGLEAHAHHGRAHELDGVRVGGVEHGHRQLVARTEALLIHLAQQIAHIHGHIAEVDLDRARVEALVADRAVVGHIFKFLPMLERHAAARLLFVEEGLDQQRGRQNLVAGRVQQIGAWHMGGTHGLALAAAQAVLDGVGNGANVRLLHDDGLIAHQAEGRRVGIGQIGKHQRFARRAAVVALVRRGIPLFVADQLALVEAAFRVHALLVCSKRRQLFIREEFQLGDADAVLARDHAVQTARQIHNAGHGFVRGLQHLIVVGVDGQIGVHIAVTGVHVQRHPDTALEHLLVNLVEGFAQRLEGSTRKNLGQRLLELGLPAGAQGVILQLGEQRGHAVQPALPQRTHLGHQTQSLLHAVFQQLGARDIARIVALAQRQVGMLEEAFQFVAKLELVAQRELDIDALDAVGVLGHARQWDHHVFIDLEGVGMARDGSCALAVQPEFLACLGADRNKAFTVARIGNAHHFTGHAGHFIGIVAGDVTQQHHLGQMAVALLALGRITHGLEIAVVQVFETGQQHARALLLGEHIVLDLDDGGHGILGIAKELHAHGARVRRHAVHHPARAGDQAVGAFLLDAGQTRQELVRHVLAQSFLAESAARNIQAFGAQVSLAVGFKVFELEAGHLGVVNLAQVVVQTRDFQPLCVGRHHAPRHEIVQRRTPENGFLATRIHGDIATDARCLDGSGIHRKDKTASLGRIGHALSHNSGFGINRGNFMIHTGDHAHLDFGQRFQLFGVDDHRAPCQRNSTACIAGAASTRNDGQTQFDTALDQTCHLGFGVRGQNDERVLDTPVGRIGHMGHARQAVELDIVLGGIATQRLVDATAQLLGLDKRGIEFMHGAMRGIHQLAHQLIAARIFVRLTALVDFREAVFQCLNQRLATIWVVNQVVLQIGVALHNPDIPQHFVEHAGRSTSATLLAQLIEHIPHGCAQQTDHDLTVRERGVVIRNLTQSCGFGSLSLQGGSQRNRYIHGVDRVGRPVAPRSQWDDDFKRGLLTYAWLWVLSNQPCNRQNSGIPLSTTLPLSTLTLLLRALKGLASGTCKKALCLKLPIETKIIHFRSKSNPIRKTTNNKRNYLDLKWRSFAHHQASRGRHMATSVCGFCPW